MDEGSSTVGGDATTIDGSVDSTFTGKEEIVEGRASNKVGKGREEEVGKRVDNQRSKKKVSEPKLQGEDDKDARRRKH